MATNANGALNLERVEQLLARPVLLPINSGEKAPWIPGWQNTSPALMMDPEYRQKLENSGNIGVLLRDGLVAIDFDDDDSAENFFEQNPSLRHGTLITRGARGCQVWLNMDGNYPRCCVRVAGMEWRGGGGCQSVNYGTHPSGIPISALVKGGPPKSNLTNCTFPALYRKQSKSGSDRFPTFHY